MFTQGRTSIAELIVGGPVPLNSYDNGIVAALFENRPVMLVNALNGGFLQPVSFKADDNQGAVKTSSACPTETVAANGHLWYITPGGYFGQRPLYFIETASGEVRSTPATAQSSGGKVEQSPTTGERPKRRRLTVHRTMPLDNPLVVGRTGDVKPEYQGTRVAEDTQLWIITVTPSGALTFVPITSSGSILNYQNNAVTVESNVRLNNHWGADFMGSVAHAYYPRIASDLKTLHHQVFVQE